MRGAFSISRWKTGTVWLGRLGLTAAVAVLAISAGGPQAHAQQVAFSPDGARYLSGGYNTKVWLWNVVTGALLRTF